MGACKFLVLKIRVRFSVVSSDIMTQLNYNLKKFLDDLILKFFKVNIQKDNHVWKWDYINIKYYCYWNNSTISEYSEFKTEDGSVISADTRGFLNYRPSVQKLIALEIVEVGGVLTQKLKPLIIEHTSANPTGHLHLGNLLNPILGDFLVKKNGLKSSVEAVYYVNDSGGAISLLITRLMLDQFPSLGELLNSAELKNSPELLAAALLRERVFPLKTSELKSSTPSSSEIISLLDHRIKKWLNSLITNSLSQVEQELVILLNQQVVISSEFWLSTILKNLQADYGIKFDIIIRESDIKDMLKNSACYHTLAALHEIPETELATSAEWIYHLSKYDIRLDYTTTDLEKFKDSLSELPLITIKTDRAVPQVLHSTKGGITYFWADILFQLLKVYSADSICILGGDHKRHAASISWTVKKIVEYWKVRLNKPQAELRPVILNYIKLVKLPLPSDIRDLTPHNFKMLTTPILREGGVKMSKRRGNVLYSSENHLTDRIKLWTVLKGDLAEPDENHMSQVMDSIDYLRTYSRDTENTLVVSPIRTKLLRYWHPELLVTESPDSITREVVRLAVLLKNQVKNKDIIGKMVVKKVLNHLNLLLNLPVWAETNL